MPTARERLAVAAAGGVLVAIGGRNGAEIDGWMAGATEVFDPATGVWDWKERAVLPVPRSGMGVAATDDAVIVMGGEGIQGLYADVNRYDVAGSALRSPWSGIGVYRWFAVRHWRQHPSLGDSERGRGHRAGDRAELIRRRRTCPRPSRLPRSCGTSP